VLDLVGFLFYDFAATALRDKRSCFNERMGKQLMARTSASSMTSIIRCSWGAYDGEGIARERVQLVDGVSQEPGVFESFREASEEEAHRPRIYAAQ